MHSHLIHWIRFRVATGDLKASDPELVERLIWMAKNMGGDILLWHQLT